MLIGSNLGVTCVYSLPFINVRQEINHSNMLKKHVVSWLDSIGLIQTSKLDAIVWPHVMYERQAPYSKACASKPGFSRHKTSNKFVFWWMFTWAEVSMNLVRYSSNCFCLNLSRPWILKRWKVKDHPFGLCQYHYLIAVRTWVLMTI